MIDTYSINIYQLGAVVAAKSNLTKREAKAMFYANHRPDRYPQVTYNGSTMTLRQAERHFGRAPAQAWPIIVY